MSSSTELFESRELIEQEIADAGVEIKFEPELRDCMAPAKVGERTVGNRFVVHPMEGCDGTLDGRPDELTVRRWQRFGEGGAKIIWGEAMAVSEDGRANTRQLSINASTAADLKELVATTREHHRRAWGNDDDLLIGFQLTHSGRYSYPQPKLLYREPARDAVTRVGPDKKLPSDDYAVITDEDLDRIQDSYIEAARISVDAGADFIDVKQCHGYLLSEMLGARRREGRHGGDLEGRVRFAEGIFRRIRADVSPDVMLATRINVFDGIPFLKDEATGVGTPLDVELPYEGGFGVDVMEPMRSDLSEPIEVIRRYRDLGVELVNVTAGCPYYNPHVGRPADKAPVDGYGAPEHPFAGVARLFDLAEQVQRAHPDLAVVGTGYSYLRHYLAMAAEWNIRQGRVGFVGAGRGMIAYPDFVADIDSTGHMHPRKSCVTVSHCTNLMRAKGNELGQYPAGCVPRDPVYAKILQQVRKSQREAK